jgi:hypothetical protein
LKFGASAGHTWHANRRSVSTLLVCRIDGFVG